MKNLIFTLLFLLTSASVFGQGSVNTTWRRDDDTSIAKTNNVRVPRLIRVGNVSDPLAGWNKAQLVAMRITDSTQGNFAGLFWLQIDSVPAGRHTTHALVAETYLGQDATDTVQYYTMVAEFSFNVAGALIDTSGNQRYLYNTIFNGFAPKVNGSDTGLIVAPNVIYVDINPLDVAAGLFGKCQIDSVYGLRIQQQDNSAIVTYSIWAGDNIHSEDTISARDRFIVGSNGTDSLNISPDSIRGINSLSPDSGEVIVIDSRTREATAYQRTNALRLMNDSGQVRIVMTNGSIYMQFADSAFANSDSVYMAGYNNTNMSKFTLRADLFDIRNLNGHTFRWPVGVPNDGDLIAVATGPVPDSGYWKDGSAVGLDSAAGGAFFLRVTGDTVPVAAHTWDLNYGNVHGLVQLQFNHGGFISAPGVWPLKIGYDGIDSVWNYGTIQFYQGGIERFRLTIDSIDGLNRVWLVKVVGIKTDSLFATFVQAPTIRTTNIEGIDTTGPITAYSELDMNGYPIINVDSLEANRVSGDTVRATVWEGLPSTLATDAEVTTRENAIRDDMRDTSALVVHDSLRIYKYKKAQHIDHYKDPLADNVWCFENVTLTRNSATPIRALAVDSAGDITPAKADTFYAVFEFDYPCVIDSAIFRAKVDNAANYLTERNFTGPDDDSPDNDSLYQTWTTDWDYTSYQTERVLLANPVSVLAGETYKIRFIVYHGQDNSVFHLLEAKLGYR